MTTVDSFALPPRPRFPVHHRWDRNFFLACLILIWLGIGAGFGPSIARHITSGAKPYPLIVHLHAAAFVGWLVLFTAQVLLVRTRRIAIHRRLGAIGAMLACAMVVLGLAAAWVVQRDHFGTSKSDPAFLSTQLLDMVAFGTLVAAGILLRKDAAAHKRLMLLSTIYITDAAFARVVAGGVLHSFGMHLWSWWAALYLCSDVLVVGLGLYDLATRRRLHPLYPLALFWIALLQGSAVWLYFRPEWKPIALLLIGH